MPVPRPANHLRRPLVPLTAIALAGLATVGVLSFGSSSVAAPGDPGSTAVAPATVSVSGDGSAVGSPDILRTTLAISSRAADVAGAIERSNAGVRRIRASLERNGVAAADVLTTDFNVDRAYSRKNPGYIAAQTMSVTIRQLAKAGRIIADAAKTGGNSTRIYGISYDIEDRAALLQKARDAAYADAKAKAERYASLAGRPLGSVRAVSDGAPVYENEDGQRDGYALKSAATSAGAADRSVPLARGSQVVNVRSTVAWDLG